MKLYFAGELGGGALFKGNEILIDLCCNRLFNYYRQGDSKGLDMKLFLAGNTKGFKLGLEEEIHNCMESDLICDKLLSFYQDKIKVQDIDIYISRIKELKDK